MGDISEEHEDRFNQICDMCGEMMYHCTCDEELYLAIQKHQQRKQREQKKQRKQKKQKKNKITYEFWEYD